MPYIPWADYNICKFWMLKRCYSGEKCQWRHPSPVDRKQLWDYMTAEQDKAAERGVPRPVNPRLQRSEETPPAGSDGGMSNEGVGDRGGLRRAVAAADLPPRLSPPPPPLPTMPPLAESSLKDGAGPVSESHLPLQFVGRESERPVYRLPAGSEVSMLDAPDSPMEKKPGAMDSQMASSQPSVGKEASEHVPSSSFPMGLDGAVAGGAVSVWRRDVAITRDTVITGAHHEVQEQPQQSNYWTQYRIRRDAMSKAKGEAAPAAEARKEASSESAKPRNLSSAARRSVNNISTTTTTTMGATKRMSNGEPKHVGPHPSTIRVSARYASQGSIEKKLQPQPAAGAQAQTDVQERLTAEAREDSIRLQGCRWLDDVRRQMQLPIRTFTTACTYYHKFRLAHPQHVAGMEYGNAWADACAASLLTACKVEDTLKKSKDVLAAAHNLRAATTGGEQVGTDDAMFEAPSRSVIGLERLVLEAGSFDFRSKYPHELMVKIAKTLNGDEEEKRVITGLAWSVLTDLHRTFAPLKQTSASMAVGSLELASHLYAAGTENDSSAIRDGFADFNFDKHSTSREEVMETILDALDLYTHHTLHTLLGSKYGLDDYLRIRLAFNKECTENSLPRFTLASPRETEQEPNGNTLRVQNGHPTPVSPPQPETQTQAQQPAAAQATPEGGGTLRFMLNPQLAADEKADVQKYFVEEWEEYEEEIEVPLPRAPSPDRMSDRSDRRPPPPGPPRPPPGSLRGDYRGPGRYDDYRGGRYDDRRYDDRRYDDRRSGRYDDRRYDDRRRR